MTTSDAVIPATRAAHPTVLRRSVQREADGVVRMVDDDVAEETPVALEYNGIAHAVMLASPSDLDNFALGFSLSEGILEHARELYDCEVVAGCDGLTVQMRIATGRFALLKERRRSLTGRTGCGLCGAETLAGAIRQPARVTASAAFSASRLQAGMRAMGAQQHLQQRTGATHGAAWMNAQGEIVLVREDVGRHNALDKLIGAMAARGIAPDGGAVLLTSRASYEMVQKCATVGIGFLAAISAPTALAIRLAERTGVTLVGFVREHGQVVYTAKG